MTTEITKKDYTDFKKISLISLFKSVEFTFWSFEIEICDLFGIWNL